MNLFRTEEKSVAVNGGSVPCVTFGRGDSDLVMIPGLRTSSIKGTALFCRLYYNIFAKNYRVYIIDRKDNVKDGCTIHDLAEDTYSAAKALGIEKAFIFGASQGGMIAQDIAVNHPGFVRGTVLAVTASRTNPTVEKAVSTWVKYISDGDLNAFAADYVNRGFSEKYRRRYGSLLPLAFRLQKMMPAERFITLAKACLTCNTYERLSEIKCPALVIGAAQDKVVSGEASVGIARRLKCRCRLYKDLSHEAYSEDKHFNRQVYDFFEECRKAERLDVRN